MPRLQTRTYTCDLLRIKATWFKRLFNEIDRHKMKLNGTILSSEHSTFQLYPINNKSINLAFIFGDSETVINLIKNDHGAARRYFFKCPFCQHSRTHLYVATNGYACRKCLDLKYLSQSEDEISRLGRKIRNLRFRAYKDIAKQFDGENLLEDSYYWPKPKGKWQDRFQKDREQLFYLESKFYSQMNSLFKSSTKF